MIETGHSTLHHSLLERRGRLAAAISSAGDPGDPGDPGYLHALMAEVDAALDRLAGGSYGLCRLCLGAIEDDRLAADPLARVCLECLDDDERRALEHDLATASQVQAALLPQPDLAADGWEVHYRYHPAGPVSGDYLDLFPPAAPGEPLHFVFGDVSGKGVAASLLMAELKAIFRALVAADRTLVEILERANRLFAEGSLPNHFATVVGGRLYASGELELVNAGHHPPLLVAAGGPRPLPSHGLPLGMFGHGGYRSERLALAPGESLLLYTDGLTEARSAAGEEYGLARLIGDLASACGGCARSVVEQSLARLDAFRAGGRRGDDDLTVMALTRLAAA